MAWTQPEWDITGNRSSEKAELAERMSCGRIRSWSCLRQPTGRYVFGYDGTGPDLQEYLVCLDEQSGKEI